MAIGDKGVKIVKPEDGGGLFHKPGTDADIDAGFDDIEDYDENAVVRRRKHLAVNWWHRDVVRFLVKPDSRRTST